MLLLSFAGPGQTAQNDWYKSISKHYDFCTSIQFEHPTCPAVTTVSDIPQKPQGPLTAESLLNASAYYRLKQLSLDWLESLNLKDKKPESIDQDLWVQAQWLYAQVLSDQKKYVESLEIFDRLVPFLKGRGLFHQQRAWVQFWSGKFESALGSILSAESPLIYSTPFPKKYLLRALVERETCQWKAASNTIAAGRKALSDMKADIEANPWVKTCVQKNGGESCERMRAWYTKAFEAEMQKAKADLDYIEIEISDRGLAQKTGEAATPIRWPYVGEHWEDELGFLAVEIDSRCAK